MVYLFIKKFIIYFQKNLSENSVQRKLITDNSDTLGLPHNDPKHRVGSRLSNLSEIPLAQVDESHETDLAEEYPAFEPPMCLSLINTFVYIQKIIFLFK